MDYCSLIVLTLTLLGAASAYSSSESSEESDSNTSSEHSDEIIFICNELRVADTGAATIASVDIQTQVVHDLDVSPTSSSLSPFPVGLDIDPFLKLMFFSSGSVVYCSNIDGDDVEVVIDLGDETKVEGLAVDPYRRKVFFTDSKSHRIGYFHYPAIHQSDPAIVALDGDLTLDDPRGIDVDTDNTMIYWTDVGIGNEHIGRAHYDGSEAEILASGGLFFNFDLTLDLEGSKVYFVNGAVIESMDLDGEDRQEVLSHVGSFFLAIEHLGAYLYVTDPLEGALQRVPKSGGILENFGAAVYTTPLNIATHCQVYYDR